MANLKFLRIIRLSRSIFVIAVLSGVATSLVGTILLNWVDSIATERIFSDLCRSITPRLQVGATRDAIDSIYAGVGGISPEEPLSIEIRNGSNVLRFGDKPAGNFGKKFKCEIPGMPDLQISLFKSFSIPSILPTFLIFILGALCSVSLTTWFRFRVSMETRERERESYLQIASQVAHDMRAPLGGINIGIQAIAKNPKEASELIRASADRLNNIAEELLSSRKRSESFFKGSFSIGDLVSCLRAEIDLLATPKIALQDSVRSLRKKLLIHGNIQLFSRVFNNLLNNAVEAATEVSGKVFVEVREDGELVNINIQNDGEDVDSETIKKLNSGNSFSTKTNGNGLGVSGAKRVVDGLGGSLNYRTRQGGGLTCEISLPVRDY